MNRTDSIRRVITALLIATVLVGSSLALAADKAGTPGSIIHVVTIKWTPESTPDQQKAALEGVKKMAAAIPGIKNVWIKATKVQPRGYSSAFVIEFENKAAADAYADHKAHRDWEKIYLPIRAESTSHQITN